MTLVTSTYFTCCFQHVVNVLQLILVADIHIFQLKQCLLQVDTLLDIVVDLLHMRIKKTRQSNCSLPLFCMVRQVKLGD